MGGGGGGGVNQRDPSSPVVRTPRYAKEEERSKCKDTRKCGFVIIVPKRLGGGWGRCWGRGGGGWREVDLSIGEMWEGWENVRRDAFKDYSVNAET